MEDLSILKELLKRDMKAKLQGTISDSLEKYAGELNKWIEKATNSVAIKVLDETKIEEIAKSAQAGAAYVAIMALIHQTAKDALREAQPMIDKLSKDFGNVLSEALAEAIVELIVEKIAKKQENSQ